MPDSEPLEIEAASARRVHVAAAQPLAKLRVQSWYGATNVPLLSFPVGSSGDGEVRVLRIGPSEWLAVSETLDAAGLALQVLAKLCAAGAAGNFALVDMTDGLQVVEIHGPAARELLETGCCLDLHPGHFPVGRCTRTRLAGLPVLIDCNGPVERFQLYVARSYVAWFTAWLIDASLDLGR